jgi:hypothetical protein
MQHHRYKVGQLLDLRSAPRSSNRPVGPCEVIACLPHDKGPILYRVRSASENNERVVEEFNLSRNDTMKTVFAEGESFFNIAIAIAKR